jgi:hypothetical protein
MVDSSGLQAKIANFCKNYEKFISKNLLTTIVVKYRAVPRKVIPAGYIDDLKKRLII